MVLNIQCPCGRELQVDPQHSGATVTCPACGRPHVLPTADRDRVAGCLPVVVSGAAALMLVGAVLWALMGQPGGMGGGGAGGTGIGQGGQGHGTGSGTGDGDDPYAGRRHRGVGAGGDGTGSGGDGTGSGDESSPTQTAQDNQAPSQPNTTASSEPQNEPTEADTATSMPEIAISDTRIDPRKPVPHPPTRRATRPASGGSGGGTTYGKRGDSDAAKSNGATEESEAAIDLGLAWLAKVQEEDGSWETSSTLAQRGQQAAQRRPIPQRPRAGQRQQLPQRQMMTVAPEAVGATGLAALAFQGAGHTPDGKGPYGQTVAKALKWLLEHQDKDGRFAINTFYEQGIATMALCEAYGMTKDERFQKPAEKGIDCIVKNMQKAGPSAAGVNRRAPRGLPFPAPVKFVEGGFGYGGPGDDVHVTSFQVMALKSAKLAKIHAPEEAFGKLRKYYDAALQPDFTTTYSAMGGAATPARTALGLFCRIFLDVGIKDPTVGKIADLIAQMGPSVRDEFQVYYGTYGMFQMGGDYWKNWNSQFRDPVVTLQDKVTEDKGSWPMGRGGRTVSTAIYIMALEVYYRFLPVNR